MGNLLNRATNHNVLHYAQSRKRRREDLDEKSSSDEESIPSTSCRPKKLITTKKYIFDTLFVRGEGSDVKVKMLGCEWKLHKLYLQQSEYFHAMFSARWDEACEMNEVEIQLIDENITVEALHLVLGSMYDGEVTVAPNWAMSVYAAASFLQLHDLANTATLVMIENISSKTVLEYSDAATKYALKELGDACYRWLLVNMTSSLTSAEHIFNINEELLLKLVSDEKLFVVNSEVGLYRYLKYWYFLRLTGNVDKEVENFFSKSERTVSYLEEASDIVKEIFNAVHLPHLLLNPSDMDLIIRDKIFSQNEILRASHTILQHILYIDQQLDVNVEMMPLDMFNKTCMRFGRRLEKPDEQFTSWRWIGFKFGMDLHFGFDGQNIILKWSTGAEQMVNNQESRKVLYRLSLVSGQVEHVNKPITSIILHHNTQVTVAKVKDKLKYPVMLSFHLVLVSPLPAPTNDDR